MAIRSMRAIGLIMYLNLPLKPLYFFNFPQNIILKTYSILNKMKKIISSVLKTDWYFVNTVISVSRINETTDKIIIQLRNSSPKFDLVS